MKKAYLVKNYLSSWGIQNRVDALVDWAKGSETPYELDICGNNALITVDDAKKTAYENEYQWDQDVAMLSNMIKDIQDPLFSDEAEISQIDLESATAEQSESFKKIALENCSSLGYDMLRLMGMDMPETEEETAPVEQSQSDRVKELEAMAKTIDLTAGMESDLADLTPDQPIEEYSRENDPLLKQAETGTVEPTSAPAEDTVEEEPVVKDVVEIARGSNARIVDPRQEFIDEFMNACKKDDVPEVVSIEPRYNEDLGIYEYGMEFKEI